MKTNLDRNLSSNLSPASSPSRFSNNSPQHISSLPSSLPIVAVENEPILRKNNKIIINNGGGSRKSMENRNEKSLSQNSQNHDEDIERLNSNMKFRPISVACESFISADMNSLMMEEEEELRQSIFDNNNSLIVHESFTPTRGSPSINHLLHHHSGNGIPLSSSHSNLYHQRRSISTRRPSSPHPIAINELLNNSTANKFYGDQPAISQVKKNDNNHDHQKGVSLNDNEFKLSSSSTLNSDSSESTPPPLPLPSPSSQTGTFSQLPQQQSQPLSKSSSIGRQSPLSSSSTDFQQLNDNNNRLLSESQEVRNIFIFFLLLFYYY